MHGRNEALHAKRKSAMPPQTCEQDNRLGCNEAEGWTDVNVKAVSPRREPLSATMDGSAGRSGGGDPRFMQ